VTPGRIAPKVFIPRDLLDGLNQPHQRRLVVTAFVLADCRQQDDRALRLARTIWPKQRLERNTHPSVASILVELETMGVCSDIGIHDGFFTVKRNPEAPK
jgi:hypothetical protein